jgi:predicted Zn-dependent protease
MRRRAKALLSRPSARRRRVATAVLATVLVGVLAAATGSATGSAGVAGRPGQSFWTRVAGKPPAFHRAARADIRADRFRAFALTRSGLAGLLRSAPAEARESAH